MVSLMPPGTPGPFLSIYFPAGCLPAHTHAWVVPLQVQNFALLIIELHDVPGGPFLQPVMVPLDGSTTLRCTSAAPLCGFVSKLAEGALCPITQTVNEDVKQDWTQH